ncbi:MAG: TonB-dependent receptor plug domain-containing protein, partial [Pyrinomonadaceae bacterium]
LTPRQKLSFTALNFFESFDQDDDQAFNIDRRTDRLRIRRTSQRQIFGATLSSIIGAKTLAQTTGWLTVSHNDGSFFVPFSTFQQRSRDLRDSQVGVKEELTSAISQKFQIAAGGGVYFDQANYHTFENGANFFSPLEEEFFAPVRENRLALETKTSAYGYVQGTWNITNRLSVTPGIRVDHYGVTNETLVSPRFGARFGLTPKISFTFAAGVYRQPPSLFVLSLTTANRTLKSQTATHFIGGIEWLAREDTRVRFEFYRKNYDDLVQRPLFPTPGFVADGNYINSGKGTAQGFEISVQKALSRFFSGQASYGYIKSRRQFSANGFEFPSDFERPHQLTLIGITKFYGFSVAAKYRFASGLPYTNRTPVELAPNSGAFLHRIGREIDINTLRLPNFASLDLRGEKRFNFKRWSISPYVDIFNITNHDSIVEPNYEFFDPNPQFLRENRRLPIFGLRVEF